MARRPRVEYEGAVYHVMSRGDHGNEIFKDALDYEIMLKTMTEVCDRCGWVLHAYVLMPTHFHWLLETPEANLVAYSRKGIWAKANMQGTWRAYSNAWFAERLVSLWGVWRKRHPVELPNQPVSDGQQFLLAL